MFFRQYYLGCLSHASYLVGDQAAGVAAVVDPQQDVDGYIADAEAAGMRIAHVVATSAGPTSSPPTAPAARTWPASCTGPFRPSC